MPFYNCRGYLLAATLTGSALLSPATATPTTDLRAQTDQQRLAVVVPAYEGDLDRAVASLGRWPTDCSSVTQENVDLVLYYAEGEEDAASVDAATTALAESAGRCFAKTLTVYAHLSEEVRKSISERSRKLTHHTLPYQLQQTRVVRERALTYPRRTCSARSIEHIFVLSVTRTLPNLSRIYVRVSGSCIGVPSVCYCSRRWVLLLVPSTAMYVNTDTCHSNATSFHLYVFLDDPRSPIRPSLSPRRHAQYLRLPQFFVATTISLINQ